MIGHYKYLWPLLLFTTKITRRNGSVDKMMFLCWIFYKFWNILFESWRYTTGDVTRMIRLFTSILIIQRMFWWMSTISIWTTVTILCRRIKWSMLFFAIILCVTFSLVQTKISFWIIFRIMIWFTVYKKLRIWIIIFVGNICYAWKK